MDHLQGTDHLQGMDHLLDTDHPRDTDHPHHQDINHPHPHRQEQHLSSHQVPNLPIPPAIPTPTLHH